MCCRRNSIRGVQQRQTRIIQVHDATVHYILKRTTTRKYVFHYSKIVIKDQEEEIMMKQLLFGTTIPAIFTVVLTSTYQFNPFHNWARMLKNKQTRILKLFFLYKIKKIGLMRSNAPKTIQFICKYVIITDISPPTYTQWYHTVNVKGTIIQIIE